MAFSDDLCLPDGPTPDSVLEQRPHWILALGFIGATLVLRVLGLDLVGAVLSCVMLCFGVMLIVDGMQRLGRYAMLYSMLCALAFFYDLLPLLADIGGRVHRSATPLSGRHAHGHGAVVTYRIVVKTTPFFEASRGLAYNAQSLAMLLSPVAMALGCFLSLSAHHQISAVRPDWDDVEPLLPLVGGGRPLRFGAASDGPERGGEAVGFDAARGHPPRPGVRTGFAGFTGRCHKLEGP